MALRFFMAVRAMIEDQVVRILPGQLQMGVFRGARTDGDQPGFHRDEMQ
jgi:hypothetical protein